jgi:hypothetical protein
LKQSVAPPQAPTRSALAIQRLVTSNRGTAQSKTDDNASEHNSHHDHDDDGKHAPHDES